MSDMRKLMEASVILEAGGRGGRWDIDDGGGLNFTESLPTSMYHIDDMQIVVESSDQNLSRAWLLLHCDDDDWSEDLADKLSRHVKRPDFLSRFLDERARFFKAEEVEGGLVSDYAQSLILIHLTCLSYPEYIVQYAN